MNNYRYILEPYKGMKTRYKCPNCTSNKKTYTRYIDTQTNDYLPLQFGKCERINNCGYFNNPYSSGYKDNNEIPQALKTNKQAITAIEKVMSKIPLEILENSLTSYENNHFVSFLKAKFGIQKTNELISKYFIGTSTQWKGSTIFWQIDIDGRIRTGKIMLYDASNGKRVKQPFNHIQWVHKIEKQPKFMLNQCLFGEYLLKQYPKKSVAIVESEKTAIIGSVYFPKFIWLAVGSITNLTKDRVDILKRRDVILFPDLKAYDKWKIKADEFGFKISEYLEKTTSNEEKQLGLDIADYLLKFDWKEFSDSS